MGLRQKIILLITIPMLALVIMSGLRVVDQWKDYKDAERAVSYGLLIQNASKLTHELQKERGKSVLFLNGATTKESLNEQRGLTDSAFANYKKIYDDNNFPPEAVNAHTSMLKSFEEARAIVDSKGAPAEAIKLYSGTIKHLFTIEISLAEIAPGGGHEKKFTSTAVLGLAKENAGKIRALVSGFIAADKPLIAAQVVQASALRSGILENLDSPTLIISKTAREELDLFKESSDWKLSMDTVNHVLDNSSNGAYNKDAKIFFELISNSINKLGSVIFNEQEAAEKAIEENLQVIKGEMFNLIAFIAFIILIVTMLTVYFIKSITAPIQQVVSLLKDSTVSINSTSAKVLETSVDLSQSTTEQAAAVQETVASLEEITAMVGKTADNAKHSTQLASTSSVTAANGQEMISKMTLAIDEISQATEKINQQITISHEELNDIVQLINDISSKTQIINDIVFQTKLLSFNASVEAARAGEAGKGFAVVAEEVGKLAVMSGSAAQEITDVLDSSISRVRNMVENTKSQVNQMMVESRTKVEQGTRTVSQCSEVLQDIVQQVQQVNVLVSEIANASSEQSQGIIQISKAMHELDRVTNLNTSSAQAADENGRQLDQKARELNDAVMTLTQIVDGRALH